MNKKEFQLIEKYMLECMQDSAHDKEHIYRVLYVALDIARYESGVDHDVLITACLLHDIGRQEQFANSELDHAIVGAERSRNFLVEVGFSLGFAEKVANCIKAHRFRSNTSPCTIEEKILFDADKVDATGTLGIARTIFYQGETGTPLYLVSSSGEVLSGINVEKDSFLREYKFKLEGLYSKFYTERGKEIALQRQSAAKSFYENMLLEIEPAYELGKKLLDENILSR